MSLMKDPEFIELDMTHGLPEHSTAERLERWKTEYLTGLRDIHSIEKRAKDTVAETQVGDAAVIHIPVQSQALWKIGRVEQLLQVLDRLVQGAFFRMQPGTTTKLLNRPLQHLYPLNHS